MSAITLAFIFTPNNAARTHIVNKHNVTGQTDAVTPSGKYNANMRTRDSAYLSSKGNMIKVQSALSAKGYYKGSKDGYEGPQTRKAFTNFQKKNSLPVTGKINGETLIALDIDSTATQVKTDSKK